MHERSCDQHKAPVDRHAGCQSRREACSVACAAAPRSHAHAARRCGKACRPAGMRRPMLCLSCRGPPGPWRSPVARARSWSGACAPGLPGSPAPQRRHPSPASASRRSHQSGSDRHVVRLGAGVAVLPFSALSFSSTSKGSLISRFCAATPGPVSSWPGNQAWECLLLSCCQAHCAPGARSQTPQPGQPAAGRLTASKPDTHCTAPYGQQAQ